MYINEPAKRIPVVEEAEVVILGGGPAGIASAVAAARSGAKTLLLERYGFLGGMGTAGGVTSFCGLYASVNGEMTQVTRGIADQLLDRLRHIDGLGQTHSILGKTLGQTYDNAAMKCVADDMILASGAALRFHALAVAAIVEASRIDAIVIETKSGRAAIRGKVFIDCSGDADLANWAGARTEKGDADGFLAFPTMMFRMGHVDDKRALEEGKPILRERIAAAQKEGRWNLPRLSASINPQRHGGEWRSNATQIGKDGRALDGTDWLSLSDGEIEGRRQVAAYLDFYRADIPGFEKAYLLEIAPQVGIRETRRLVGQHVISEDEILSASDANGAIGVNGWPIERHFKGDVEWRFIPGRGYHQMPFAALVPTNIDNLLVAGRCASATPIGQSSIRVSGPCFVMGEAAGTAAAMAVNLNGRIASVDTAKLQSALAANNVFMG